MPLPENQAYRVVDWLKFYENNRTRELKETKWVPIPNKHDGDGYTLLVDRENGAALLGAWVACVQVASKCDPRGTLLRDPVLAHDSASLSRITRIPANLFDAMFAVCLKECKWLEIIDMQTGAVIPQESATASHLARARGNGMEWKGMEVLGDKAKPEKPQGGGIGEFKIKVGKIFQRKETDHWKQPEEFELVQVFKREDKWNELAIIENAYGRGQKFLPQSVGRLLEDWTGTLDKARNPDPAGGKGPRTPEQRQRVEGLEGKTVDFTKKL